MTDTVTGRTYHATRVRGFADWNPRPGTLRLLDLVKDILDEYRAQLPLTVRQIFYRLVGAHGYEKTEQAYGRLCENLNRARRASLIDFSAIRDDGTVAYGAGGYSGPAQFWDIVRYSARNYTHDLSDGQPRHVELWVEATGMVPQAVNVASRYGIGVYSAGGFNGLTDKYETAQRLSEHAWSLVLHVGDYDPSGCAIVDSLAADVVAFCDELNPGGTVDFERIVVTPAQIARHDLPTAPQKSTDRRGERMTDTVQAEALPPDVLAAEIDAACADAVDLDIIEEMRQLGETERAEILAVLADVPMED